MFIIIFIFWGGIRSAGGSVLPPVLYDFPITWNYKSYSEQFQEYPTVNT